MRASAPTPENRHSRRGGRRSGNRVWGQRDGSTRLADGQVLEWTSGGGRGLEPANLPAEVVDNAAAKRTGEWAPSGTTPGFVGADYLQAPLTIPAGDCPPSALSPAEKPPHRRHFYPAILNLRFDSACYEKVVRTSDARVFVVFSLPGRDWARAVWQDHARQLPAWSVDTDRS